MTDAAIKHLSDLGGLGLAWALVWMMWKNSREMARALHDRSKRDEEIIVANTKAMDAMQRELADRPCMK